MSAHTPDPTLFGNAAAGVHGKRPERRDEGDLLTAKTPTSRAAARRTRKSGKAAIDRDRVLAALIDAGPRGATDEQLQHALDLMPQTETPRRYDLVKAGLVTDSGRKRPTTSGCSAIVWLPTPSGFRDAGRPIPPWAAGDEDIGIPADRHDQRDQPAQAPERPAEAQQPEADTEPGGTRRQERGDAGAAAEEQSAPMPPRMSVAEENRRREQAFAALDDEEIDRRHRQILDTMPKSYRALWGSTGRQADPRQSATWQKWIIDPASVPWRRRSGCR